MARWRRDAAPASSWPAKGAVSNPAPVMAGWPPTSVPRRGGRRPATHGFVVRNAPFLMPGGLCCTDWRACGMTQSWVAGLRPPRRCMLRRWDRSFGVAGRKLRFLAGHFGRGWQGARYRDLQQKTEDDRCGGRSGSADVPCDGTVWSAAFVLLQAFDTEGTENHGGPRSGSDHTLLQAVFQPAHNETERRLAPPADCASPPDSPANFPDAPANHHRYLAETITARAMPARSVALRGSSCPPC